MTPLVGLFIAFLSGTAWAGLDVARKSLTARHDPLVVATGLSLGAATLFAVASMSMTVRIDVAAYAGPGLLSMTLSIATQLLVLESVRRSALSRTIPMLSLTPVATALFGVAVLGERPSGAAWLGIMLVFVGAVVLALTGHDGPQPGSGRLRLDRGAALMVLAALSISAAAPFDKLAVAASTAPVHGLIQSLGSGALLLGVLTLRGERGKLVEVFRRRPAMLAAVLLVFAAIGLQFFAYRGAMVGEVETIKRVVGLLSSLGAGFLVFGERVTAAKVLAVVALAAGVALIMWGATPH